MQVTGGHQRYMNSPSIISLFKRLMHQLDRENGRSEMHGRMYGALKDVRDYHVVIRVHARWIQRERYRDSTLLAPVHGGGSACRMYVSSCVRRPSCACMMPYDIFFTPPLEGGPFPDRATPCLRRCKNREAAGSHLHPTRQERRQRSQTARQSHVVL